MNNKNFSFFPSTFGKQKRALLTAGWPPSAGERLAPLRHPGRPLEPALIRSQTHSQINTAARNLKHTCRFVWVEQYFFGGGGGGGVVGVERAVLGLDLGHQGCFCSCLTQM